MQEPDMSQLADWTPDRVLADIEAMIRREGHRQYSATLHIEQGVYLSQLCGVSAYLVRKTGMTRLFTHDMDIVITSQGTISFNKGNMPLLCAHHRNLCAYRRAIMGAMMPSAAPAVPTQIAREAA